MWPFNSEPPRYKPVRIRFQPYSKLGKSRRAVARLIKKHFSKHKGVDIIQQMLKDKAIKFRSVTDIFVTVDTKTYGALQSLSTDGLILSDYHFPTHTLENRGWIKRGNVEEAEQLKWLVVDL